MVAEKMLVEEEIRSKLWASGLPDDQIAAIVAAVLKSADVTMAELDGRWETLTTALGPVITRLVEAEVDRRLGRMERQVGNLRRATPIPKSNYFDEDGDQKPRRRWGRIAALGFGAMILGPIALSLFAAGLKALLGLMLHLLS